MTFKSIPSFNHYVHAQPPRHDWIDIGAYPEGFRLSSPKVYPNFYRISIKYGFEDGNSKGFMYFSSPNNPLQWETEKPWTGYYIQLTEDVISKYQHLAYSFLTYGLHEPLYLEKEEEEVITCLFKDALMEYTRDNFSMDLLVAYCNLMFAHIARFYERQFGERKEEYNQLVNGFFRLLNAYYTPIQDKGNVQPTVKYFASSLNVTPNYLSDVIKVHTGQSALEHIHQHIVEVAKSSLIQKKSSISEIAYQLGFEYPNYFSRLFRKVTGVSPTHFRKL